ncbi:MAG: transcriptional regulator [Armatimonadota bacterium]
MSGKLILIESDILGGPDRDLGRILMEVFLRNLGNRSDLPACIVLVNGGVHLATLSSPVLDHLKKLEQLGVKIVSCRTCVEFFDIEQNIGVGVVDGMVGILELLASHEVLTI